MVTRTRSGRCGDAMRVCVCVYECRGDEDEDEWRMSAMVFEVRRGF